MMVVSKRWVFFTMKVRPSEDQVQMEGSHVSIMWYVSEYLIKRGRGRCVDKLLTAPIESMLYINNKLIMIGTHSAKRWAPRGALLLHRYYW